MGPSSFKGNMKNIAILGWGVVGRATAKFLTDPERQIIAYDENKSMAKHINAGNKVQVTRDLRVDALIVCINVEHPYANTGRRTNYATQIANEIRHAINDCEVPLREGAPILIRTTVPPGTCDVLQNLFASFSVLAWPEFSKESSMRQGYEIKAPYLGLSPGAFDEDHGEGRLIAGMLLHNSGLVLGAEITENVYTNIQVEFMKLAWNVRRATDVAVFNELVRGAVDLGIDPVMAEHLAENAKPASPQFSTLAFGGKCLDKDLWMWDAAVTSNYGDLVRSANRQGVLKTLKMAETAHTLLGLPHRPVTILGLQDGPSSGDCSHSPALQIVRAKKWIDAPVFVDSIKTVRDRFVWLLVKKGVERARVATPDEPSNSNVIVIAQKSHGPITYNALIKVLQASPEPVKIVVNGCNMHLHEHQIIEAMKYGAVFVDQQELNRMLQERASQASANAA